MAEPSVKVVMADQEYTVRPVRGGSGLKAAMLLGKYVRKSETAMLMVANLMTARQERDIESTIRFAAQLWDAIEPDLEAATDDLFVLLELATGIDRELLRDGASLTETIDLLRAVMEVNDVRGILALAGRLMPNTAQAIGADASGAGQGDASAG